MTSSVPIILRQDFEPYIEISENTNFEDIRKHLIAIQNEQLCEVLGQDLFDDFIALFELEKNITAISAGATTTISADNLDDIANDYYVLIDDIEGTIGTDEDRGINGNYYQISGLSGLDFTIDAETEDLNYTEDATEKNGVIKNVMTEAYYTLRQKMIPFLCYATYARYIPKSILKDTPAGLKIKEWNQSKTPDGYQLGLAVKNENKSADFWRNKLIEFLEDNIETYPLLVSSTVKESVIGSSSIAIFPKTQTLFRRRRPRI